MTVTAYWLSWVLSFGSVIATISTFSAYRGNQRAIAEYEQLREEYLEQRSKVDALNEQNDALIIRAEGLVAGFSQAASLKTLSPEQRHEIDLRLSESKAALADAIAIRAKYTQQADAIHAEFLAIDDQKWQRQSSLQRRLANASVVLAGLVSVVVVSAVLRTLLR